MTCVNHHICNKQRLCLSNITSAVNVKCMMMLGLILQILIITFKENKHILILLWHKNSVPTSKVLLSALVFDQIVLLSVLVLLNH